MSQLELKIVNTKSFSSEEVESKIQEDFELSPQVDIIQDLNLNLARLEMLQNQFSFMVLELRETIS